MNTYWVLENIKEHDSFYNKLDILLLISSVHLWRKNNKNSTTNLIVDKLTYDLLHSVNATYLWDNVEILPKFKSIDKSVFWASSKLQVLRNVKGPSLIMDHDFLVYKNIENYLQDKPFFAYEEDGTSYYDTAWNKYINKAKHIIVRPSPFAINCCFCYFPDSKFTNHYAQQSLELMEFFTNEKVPNSKYLIFAEQLLLKYLLDKFNIEYDTLLNEKWHARDKIYIPSDKGHITYDDSGLIYRHYWMEKNKIKRNEDGYSLEYETSILNNILSKTEVDLKYINNAL